MPIFQVRQEDTKAIVWTGSADGEVQALDAMAHSAGYRDYSELPAVVRRGGVSVEVLAFDPPGGGERVTGGRDGQFAGRSGTYVASRSKRYG